MTFCLSTKVIRKQEVNLLIYKGVDENETAMKQIASGIFEGKNGKAIISVICV